TGRASGDVRGGARPVLVAERKEAKVFQAKKWGWKRIAAKLLLVPVLTGGSVAAAHAQMSPPPPGTPVGQSRSAGPVVNPSMPGGPIKPADPKMLLKEGRKALAAGNFDAAQD